MNIVNNWYKSLSLSRRFIYVFNLVLFVTLSIIAIPALLNRVNNQYTDARNLLFPNLDEFAAVLELAGEENWEDYKSLFYNKNLYNTGFASMISYDGQVLIDPQREGQNLSDRDFFRVMAQEKRGRVQYLDNQAPSDRQRKHVYYGFYEPLNSYLTFTIDHKELIGDPLRNTTMILVFAFIFSSLIFTLTMFLITKTVSRPVKILEEEIRKISKGQLPEITLENPFNDEVGRMLESIKIMLKGLKEKALFANEIGENNFNHEFTPLSKGDELGNSLVEMRDSLKKAAEEEKLRKIEDEKRNWSTHGLTMFSDILRQKSDDIENLSFEIIKNIVKYLEANQGGIFIINEENRHETTLELTACYAFDRRKYLEKHIQSGEGLVGACYLEQKSTMLTNIPQNYIRIVSGLGGENPGCLLLIPIKLNEKVYGVIELAGFKAFEPHQIEFLEKLGESIASAISTAKTSQQTTMLLNQSQQQAEEMRAQEEEMRQNMEEMQATQEEMQRKEEQNREMNKELEKKIQEFTQKESEQLGVLKAINNACLYAEFGLDGTVLHVNDFMLNFLGMQKEDIVGYKHADFDDLTKNKEAYESFWNALKKGEVKTKASEMKLDEKSVRIHETYSPLVDSSGIAQKVIYLAYEIA